MTTKSALGDPSLTISSDDFDPEPTVARYRSVRSHTEALARPLSAEDQMVQSMPDVSPTKWHRAHGTWFFETFLLPHLQSYEIFNEAFGYLYNSYYEAVGDRHPRSARGVVSRPSTEQIAAYRSHVDEAMLRLIRTAVPERPDLQALVELGLQHEQQHQELLLMDIKHVFSSTVLKPAYVEQPVPATALHQPLHWIEFEGGVVDVGVDAAAPGASAHFSFDNEAPQHRTILQPFRLGDRLITNAEWLEFITDRGYETASLWLSEGWNEITAGKVTAPLYWRDAGDDGWLMHTLSGERPVQPSEPVCHVSLFEADAFATWAGARLPTEAEWEHAAAGETIRGNLLEVRPDDDRPAVGLHPEPAGDPGDSGLRQMFGDVWEWTSSAYSPYPGFVAAPGAVGEYNGKFMINQMVLRGGSCITPADHIRSTYRNFFPASARWQFGGVRLAVAVDD